MVINLYDQIELVILAYAQNTPDDNGVMMYDYHGVQRKVYNPHVVASSRWNYYVQYQTTGLDKYRIYFLNTANWLLHILLSSLTSSRLRHNCEIHSSPSVILVFFALCSIYINSRKTKSKCGSLAILVVLSPYLAAMSLNYLFCNE